MPTMTSTIRTRPLKSSTLVVATCYCYCAAVFIVILVELNCRVGVTAFSCPVRSRWITPNNNNNNNNLVVITSSLQLAVPSSTTRFTTVPTLPTHSKSSTSTTARRMTTDYYQRAAAVAAKSNTSTSTSTSTSEQDIEIDHDIDIGDNIHCYVTNDDTLLGKDNTPNVVCTSEPEEYAWFNGIDLHKMRETDGTEEGTKECVEGHSYKGIPEWECE